MPHHDILRKERGLTLIEVLIAMTIGAVLLAMAGPSFTQIIASQRIKSVATDVYLALVKARSEALKLNTNVTLQPLAASDWASGWYIANPDATVTTRLLEHGAVSNITVTGSNVTYRPSGRVQAASAPTFSISSAASTTKMCVSVDLSGRPYQKSIESTASC
jgi:type IV fimbrial biogenesis protein FimT